MSCERTIIMYVLQFVFEANKLNAVISALANRYLFNTKVDSNFFFFSSYLLKKKIFFIERLLLHEICWLTLNNKLSKFNYSVRKP